MLYDYKCKECGHPFEKRLMMADRKLPESEPCPSCDVVGSVSQAIVGATAICDPIRMGRTKPAAGFNEVLRNIKKDHPGSTMNIRD